MSETKTVETTRETKARRYIELLMASAKPEPGSEFQILCQALEVQSTDGDRRAIEEVNELLNEYSRRDDVKKQSDDVAHQLSDLKKRQKELEGSKVKLNHELTKLGQTLGRLHRLKENHPHLFGASLPLPHDQELPQLLTKAT